MCLQQQLVGLILESGIKMKKVKVSSKLLKDIYEVLCESSKIDWDDRVTSRLERAIAKNEKEIQKTKRVNKTRSS